ncbi:glycine-rich domain-containing protein [Simplicispira piscis]
MLASAKVAPTMTGFEHLLLRVSGLLVPLAAVPWVIALVGVPVGWWEPEGRWTVYLVCTLLAVMGARRWALAVRERFIREAPLPQLLKRKLRDTYPLLSPKDADLVERGLRQFFMACLRSDKHFVAMPSRAVDALWNAFSQIPQTYQHWCQNALGYVPEHSPAQVLGKKAHHNDGLRRAWYWACKDEAIHPRLPSRLPLLFALDTKLAIPDGFHYAPGPQGIAKPDGHHRPAGTPYFGTDFSDSNFTGNFLDFGGAEPARRKTSGSDGGDSGFGDDGDSGDGGSDGGGD